MNKIKNFTTALLVSAVSIVSSQACDSAGTGFHVGAALGAAQTTVKHSVTKEGDGSGSTTHASHLSKPQNDLGKAAGLFGLVLGYTADFGNGAVGGIEVSAGLDTTKVEDKGTIYLNDGTNTPIVDTNNFSSKLKRSHYYGLAGRLGYKFSPSALAYVKAGIEAGKWKAEVTPPQITAAQTSTTEQTDADAFNKVATRSKNNINFLLGGGMEVFLNKNVSLRGEYTYLFGPKLTVEKDTSKADEDFFGADKRIASFKTNQHRVQLVVSYYF